MTLTNPFDRNVGDAPLKPASRYEQADMEQMHDVFLLLESLVRREEITVKLILNSLYDIGSRALINQNIRRRPLKKVLRWTARWTKPLAMIIGLRWFKRNAPQLIADWLYLQASFEDLSVDDMLLAEAAASEEELPAQLDKVQQITESNPDLETAEGDMAELNYLRRRVRLLTGLTIGALAMMMGVLIAS